MSAQMATLLLLFTATAVTGKLFGGGIGLGLGVYKASYTPVCSQTVGARCGYLVPSSAFHRDGICGCGSYYKCVETVCRDLRAESQQGDTCYATPGSRCGFTYADPLLNYAPSICGCHFGHICEKGVCAAPLTGHETFPAGLNDLKLTTDKTTEQSTTTTTATTSTTEVTTVTDRKEETTTVEDGCESMRKQFPTLCEELMEVVSMSTNAALEQLYLKYCYCDV